MSTYPETLTKTERLILANQMRILAQTEPKGGNEKEYYERMEKMLREGYTLNYGDLYQGIYDELSRERCEYVLDVLDMYWAMQGSHERLNDKEGIEAESLVFPGFDGNNEGELMGYAEYLVEEEGKFATLRHGKDFNSHSMTNHKYPDMLDKWKDMGDDSHELSAAQIKEILAR